MVKERVVSTEEAALFARIHDMIFLETSAKEPPDNKFHEIIDQLAKDLKSKQDVQHMINTGNQKINLYKINNNTNSSKSCCK